MQPLDPVIEEIQDLMGRYEVLRMKGDKVGAQKIIEQILQAHPNHPNAVEAQADWLRDEGKISEARAIYKELIDEYEGRVGTEKKYADLVFKTDGQSAEIKQLLASDNIRNLLAPPETARNPNASAVLSFLLPGLGQISNGELTRGLTFLAWSAASWLTFVTLGHVSGQATLTTAGYLAVASIALASIIATADAYVGAPKLIETAKSSKKERPKPPVDLPFE